MSREDIEFAISLDDPGQLLLAVLSAALYSEDRQWAESVCLRLSQHPHENVRGNSVIGLGHIARIHGALDQRAHAVISSALLDPSRYVRGQAVFCARRR